MWGWGTHRGTHQKKANNVLGEFFGEARLAETLSGRRGLGLVCFMQNKKPLTSPTELCRRVRGAVDEREIGGLGILMVKKLMDDVSYARDQGRNVLRFRKQC